MGFDFNKGPGSGAKKEGFSSPFGEGQAQKKPDGKTGFSFGGGNDTKPVVNKSGGGFKLPTGKKSAKSGGGYDNLPAIPEKQTPEVRETGIRHRSRGSFDASEIPWKAIIYFVMVIIAGALIIYYWDTILYVAYNLIVLLIAIVVLLLLIRWLLRKR